MVWNPGQQLFGDRYIIERKLGEGGIGITYLAKNRRGELRVIKTLREQILNHPAWIPHQDKLRHDFRDEALRLALCRHPHIVQVENVFDEENLPCMAMEYIEGEDLGKRITNTGALPEAEALQYIRQIGDALTLVHDKGLLHRDLKPSNIMMRAGKPEAVLIDFGLARQFISGAVQQHTESLTPGYAPPEQYIPDAERGEYIDVYALAATLYSLLTGQLPMPVPVRLQNFTMRSPKDFNSAVSDRVNDAIMRGMALNYKFRPQSIQEWLDFLGSVTHNWECVHTISGQEYSHLRDLLASGKWRRADLETQAIMFGSSYGLMDSRGNAYAAMINLSCSVIKMIDNLWVEYSNGRFGFSVQNKIWERVDAHIGNFASSVGWVSHDGSAIPYKDVQFRISAPVGHLPCFHGNFYTSGDSCLLTDADQAFNEMVMNDSMKFREYYVYNGDYIPEYTYIFLVDFGTNDRMFEWLAGDLKSLLLSREDRVDYVKKNKSSRVNYLDLFFERLKYCV